MKKLVSVFMTIAMLLTLATTAFATTLTINGEAGREYVGHKLLKLTTSLKTGEHHPTTCDNVNHSDDCYNFAYTLNETYKAVLQAEVFGNVVPDFWGDDVPTTADEVTEKQILTYISALTSDSGTTYGSLRQVADRLYLAIKAANIDPEATGLDGNADTIEQGYWMIADVTNLDGVEDAANSLVMVDTKGQGELTVTPKIATPAFEKKVKDIEDSEDATIEDNYWHDSADFDIGDANIPFKLTGTMPSNARAYTTYTMIFHDTLPEALTLNADSVVVYMYDSKFAADVDIDMNDYKAIVADTYYEVKTTGLTDDCSFEVIFENTRAIPGATADTAFVVYYEATLGADGVVIGGEGNVNSAYLEYTNDPYTMTTGDTEEDIVTVYTYKLVINKTDSHGHPLAGAGFTLSKKNADGSYTVIGTEKGGLANPTMTTFEWAGLDDGDYLLEETTVPEGYNEMADIAFSITAAHSETADTPALLSLDGGSMGLGDLATGTITKGIENLTGTVLPETGARGTMMLIGGGSMFVLLAAVFMITRKKMSIYED